MNLYWPAGEVMVLAAMVCLWACSCTFAADGKPAEYYVSPKGDDAWSGRLAEPAADGKDGPFVTLDAARDAIRKLADGKRSGVSVYLRGGTYVRDKSFGLTADDSGSAGASVVYRGFRGEQAILVGGREVADWRGVVDKAVLDRLPAEARGKVLQADLKAQGITDFGKQVSRGFTRRVPQAAMELFFDGKPMTLSRWPNEGFAKIADVPKADSPDGITGKTGDLKGGFFYEGDRPRNWKDLSDVWMHGYWTWDWADSYERVASIDLEKRHVLTVPPYGLYGFRKDQRFYWLNVLEELDSPGEWYLDRETGMLYFWPPSPIKPGMTWVSTLSDPIIRMDGASYVELRDLTLECTRAQAVDMRRGQRCLVADCTIRNIGSDAITISGGLDHGVTGCDISQAGDGGVIASGGDRKTLTPCGHFIENNHIHHVARWDRCYKQAVSINGVGMRVSHNLIHDHPHNAIIFSGNDHIIEFNEIHHVATDTGDVGAIYVGRDWTFLGNVIRYNYIHDVGGVGDGAMGMYCDDSASGINIYGNVFKNVRMGVLVGGGRWNTVENNIFIDCKTAVEIDGRGLDQRPNWNNMVYKIMKPRLEAMNYKQPPYSTRHPELQELDKYLAVTTGVPPEGNRVLRNVCVGNWLLVRWGADLKIIEIKDNFTEGDPLFVDAAEDDFRLKPDSPVLKLGFKPIPFDQFGPANRSTTRP